MITIPLDSMKIQTREKPLGGIMLHYLAVLVAICVISIVISPLWPANLSLAHTALELACVFIALAAFFVVWHTYERTTPVNHLVGFGFLAVAVFDMLHIYYFQELNLFPPRFLRFKHQVLDNGPAG